MRSVPCRTVCRGVEKPVSTVPQGPQETANQAADAAKAAFKDGIAKQRVEFLPPLTGATDLDDWPGGIRQMFTAILPMVERFLSSVKFTDALQCQLESQILDDGDAVALWSGENLKALLFPTGDSLLKAKSLPPTDVKLFVLINPQWQEGQVISDFGFGRRKEDIERFLEDFQYTYFLKQYRIQGLDVRVLRCYPADWCIFVSDEDGSDTCISQSADKPSYSAIEQALRDSGMTAGSILERVKKEFSFNIKTLKQQP